MATLAKEIFESLPTEIKLIILEQTNFRTLPAFCLASSEAHQLVESYPQNIASSLLAKYPPGLQTYISETVSATFGLSIVGNKIVEEGGTYTLRWDILDSRKPWYSTSQFHSRPMDFVDAINTRAAEVDRLATLCFNHNNPAAKSPLLLRDYMRTRSVFTRVLWKLRHLIDMVCNMDRFSVVYGPRRPEECTVSQQERRNFTSLAGSAWIPKDFVPPHYVLCGAKCLFIVSQLSSDRFTFSELVVLGDVLVALSDEYERLSDSKDHVSVPENSILSILFGGTSRNHDWCRYLIGYVWVIIVRHQAKSQQEPLRPIDYNCACYEALARVRSRHRKQYEEIYELRDDIEELVRQATGR